MIKEASVEHPIHELIAKRWSPYGYSDRPVSAADTETLSDAYKERDLTPRKRKQLKDFVFSGKWGVSSELVG
jgi:hypothetical protein